MYMHVRTPFFSASYQYHVKIFLVYIKCSPHTDSVLKAQCLFQHHGFFFLQKVFFVLFLVKMCFFPEFG